MKLYTYRYTVIVDVVRHSGPDGGARLRDIEVLLSYEPIVCVNISVHGVLGVDRTGEDVFIIHSP
jgi:hypothetical protein